MNSHDFELAAKFGNLISRGLKFTEKTLGGEVPDCNFHEIFSYEELRQKVDREFEAFRLEKAVDHVVSAINSANKFFSDQTPWKKYPEESKVILRSVLEAVYFLAHLLSPILPNATEKVVPLFPFFLVFL